jgi:mannosyltransferase OCH1-like enzyme
MAKVIKSHRRRVPGHGRLLTVATLLFCVCCWVLANHSRGAALAAGAATPGIAASGIPRLTHHMHINETALSPAQARLREGCQKLHPDWQFKFWTDELLEAFVKEEFADFYPEWIKIEPRIKQLDSSRYMLMHRFGGIYMDVDVECVRNLNGLIDPLPPGAAWVGDWPEPSILASAPNNQLWLHVLSRIARVWRTLDAWHSTGPAGLGAAILEYVQVRRHAMWVSFLCVPTACPEL